MKEQIYYFAQEGKRQFQDDDDIQEILNYDKIEEFLKDAKGGIKKIYER